jgi:hypothetical protein
MSKTVRIELADVAAWPNLEAALWAAARGKRGRPDVQRFLAQAECRLAEVREALLQARLPVGSLRAFAIRDPKPRIIHAADFADRVAHHALVRLLEPRLERALVPTSFACRPGKGVHAALVHALAQSRRWPSYLKLDVRHCFPSIPHDGLLAVLARRVRGGVWPLLEHIVRSHAVSREGGVARGLPIGSLTSQHFANQYLGELDRRAITHPVCRGHLRYMDDLVLWCDSPAAARELFADLDPWLRRQLGLEFKPPVIQRSDRGLLLCGFRVSPGGLRMSPRRQRAWRAHWLALNALVNDAGGAETEAEAQRRAEVLRSLALPATTSVRWQNAVMSGPHRAGQAAPPSSSLCSPPAQARHEGRQARASRRQLEQQRQELPLRQPLRAPPR